MSIRSASRSTLKLASSRPSLTWSVSSKPERPVELLMQKLSSQETGHGLGPAGWSTFDLELASKHLRKLSAIAAKYQFEIGLLRLSADGILLTKE